MNYVSAKNGVVYYTLNEEIIRFHIKELNSLIVISNKVLNQNEIEDNTFTSDEYKEGYRAVYNILKGKNEVLLNDYFRLFSTSGKVSNDEVLLFAKADKKADIDKKRDEAIESGVEYKGKVFQSAEKDRNLLTSTTSLFSITKQVPQSFKWISKDNEAVDFTLQDLIALGAKMAESVNLNTMKARALKDKVEKARNLNELESIQWT
ncbi:DUF4376 domain-containing protein [Campylobacter helveticus]|uniref:DUF4376 domain-containing protein n=1 Tax=Campylobacter helveticus TaxID=28898 RepID=UPI0009C2D053|nr:DUF4376 domain-containing protein [Campylobacter helveticus]ARE80364.1 hypothetical protein (DUF4376 domain) [Campylobacter helveticus]TXK54931.1 DUF4376 domain-containing protein [Campylobacter helveticus]SMC24660.1 protein of unknown function [Campylobacter helveticus]SUW83081.1 Uncharacterised protein [Campylobacter helveticus]